MPLGSGKGALKLKGDDLIKKKKKSKKKDKKLALEEDTKAQPKVCHQYNEQNNL